MVDLRVLHTKVFSSVRRESLHTQVNNNLFSFAKPASKTDEDTPTSPTPSDIKFYINELQLQFATVISKPSTSSKDKKSMEGGVDPKFYNVRPMGGVNKEEGESDTPQGVDEEVRALSCAVPTSVVL